jgi:exonuclease SbcC
VKPKRLQLVGLRSWKTERELRFEHIDLAAVIGPTGAGKSSILEAIVYALYNSSTFDNRGVGSLISSDSKTMSVTLDFDADGESWRATRSTSRSSYPPSVHKLSCLTNPGEHATVDGERAVNAAIQTLIGLDREQFLTAVLLPQGRFQTLLMATPAERSAILKGVFRLDELDAIRERAANMRRGQVEPTLDAKQAERSRLLPNPEAALVEATAEATRCTQIVEKLDEFEKQHQGFLGRAIELETAVKSAHQRADSLDVSAKAIPSLDGIVEAEAEIGKAEAELRAARTKHVIERDQAQSNLDKSAAVGVSIETLATSRQVLDTAYTALPELEKGQEALEEAREVLAKQQIALEEETSEHTKQVVQLTSTEKLVGTLKTNAQQANANLTDATRALQGLRTAEDQAGRSRAAVAAHDQQLTKATAVATTAAAQATTTGAAAASAEAVLATARNDHQAAHLASGLHAGDSCPICERQLPDGFTPRTIPAALEGAETEVARLRKVAQDSAAAANKASANVETLTEQLIGLRSTNDLAIEEAGGARATAEGLLGSIDLGHEDAVMVASVREVADTAKSVYEEADRGLTGTKARLDAAAASLQHRAQTCIDRTQELESEEARISRERNAQLSTLAGVPAEFKPSTNAPEALAAARDAASARLAELQNLHEGVRTANAEVERLDNDLAARTTERTETIDNPRREATGSAREIAAKLRELRPEAEVPKQPDEAATIAEHALWVSEIVALALDLVRTLNAKASKDEIAIRAAKNESETALRDAEGVTEAQVKTAADLGRQLNLWRARVIAAEKEREKATEHIPKAALLDTRIDNLRRRRDSLEEMCRLLGDGHFIKWLVERRQQLLLVVASEIFAGMTGGRYRFAADFMVIDGSTGIARNPRTLSGGEGFMASLALALGMAEIAARSGGRIGSLYLDEGFGALDPNALDEAITALELRARSGQMILIVSHVPAIAQRIERILEVRPEPTGSIAEWLDDEDRESLLVGAVSTEA